MKRLAALLVVVLLFALPVAAQDGGTPTPEVRVVDWNPETGELHLVITFPDAATPTPTATVAPPTIQPTHTPQPPTVTPTPPPTRTPQPTQTAVCMGRVVTTAVLNIRAGVGTGATVVAKAQPGSRWQIHEVAYDAADNEWARVQLADGRAAWMASYYSGQEWVRYDETPDCALVRFGEGSNPFVTPTPRPTTPAGPSPTPTATSTPAPFQSPTPETMGVGWTTTFGYDRPALFEAGDTLRSKGYAPSVTLTSNAGEACAFAAQGWRVLVRPWYALGLGDDPDLSMTPENSARARVAALAGYVRLLCADSANVTIQLTNETSWPSASYLNRWILAACAECEARGWTCAPVMFSVGTPELDWFPTLRPALARMTAGQHYMGYNSYGYHRDAMLCDVGALYTVWRVRLMRVAAGQPFPRVWVSEAARGAGDVPPVASDAACFVRQSDGLHANVNLWCAGECGAWSGGRWYADAMRALVSIL